MIVYEPEYCHNCGVELDADEHHEVECWPCRSRDRTRNEEERDGKDMSQAATDFAMRYHYGQVQSN